MNTNFNNKLPTNFESDWLPSDSRENFKKNLKLNPELLKKLGWTGKNIMYKTDKYGFRNDADFSDDYYNLALGCSNTFGIGVNEQDVWYNHLKKHFSEPFYNAGIPGGSLGGCYRSLTGLLNEGMKVKRIFMFIPSKERYEVYNTVESIWTPVAWWTDHSNNIKKYLLNDESLDKFRQVHMLAIKHICYENNIEIVDLDFEDNYEVCNCKSARDLSHPGIETHKLIGKMFYDEYSKRYNSKN
jgi:hypothetical protein